MPKGQFKTYLLLGLVVIAAVVAYFRFIHTSSDKSVPPKQESTVESDLGVPAFSESTGEKRVGELPPFFESVPPPVGRDIFSPLKWPEPKRREPPKEGLEKEPEIVEVRRPEIKLMLMGTIVGGANSMAIINDQYLRLGEYIEDWEVSEITKSTVVLRAGDEEIILEVSKEVVTQ
jgi:hypothetical protein